MVSPSFKLAQYRDELRPQIEAALDGYTRLGDGCPSELGEAIRYSLLAPGKRLRPMLVVMAAEACGGQREAALPAACAVEMVHAYSLIHDDLPAMDDDDLRRGRPTCHKKFGEALAILAGDALLALAFETLAEGVRPASTAARCCAALGHAAGPCQLVGGQADDILGKLVDTDAANDRDSSRIPAETARIRGSGCRSTSISNAGLNSDPTAMSTDEPGEETVALVESIHRRKTGGMIRVSVHLGGLVAGADDGQLAALDRFAGCLGLAFQITDDLLDAQGVEAQVGKRVQKDKDQGTLTFPRLLGIDRSVRRAEELVDDACAAIRPLGQEAECLEAMARYVLERQQ